jgi:hypothetical protein
MGRNEMPQPPDKVVDLGYNAVRIAFDQDGRPETLTLLVPSAIKVGDEGILALAEAIKGVLPPTP